MGKCDLLECFEKDNKHVNRRKHGERICNDFQKLYDRLENINSFRKGLNTFLDNRPLLGLTVKWMFGGDPGHVWMGFPKCDIRSPSVRTCWASVLPGQ